MKPFPRGRSTTRVHHFTAETDDASGTLSKLTRFLTREEALAVNPGVSKLVLKEQAPLELPDTDHHQPV
jgi:hypothetical protein